MEKESSRLILRVTPAIFLITLLVLYYNYYCSNFLQFDQWVEINSVVNINIDEVEISQTLSKGVNATSHEISEDEQVFKDINAEPNSTINKHEQRGVNSQKTNGTIDDHELKLIGEEERNKTDDHILWPESEKVTDTTDDLRRQFTNIEKNQTAEQVLQVSSKEVHKTRERPDSTPSPLSRLVRGEDLNQLTGTGFACDAGQSFIVCLSDKNVSIDTRTMTIYVPNDHKTAKINNTEVRPYARREDLGLLQGVTPIHIIQGNATPPRCQYTHNEPAVIFSSGGFTGNLFHEFNEVIIPLFITTHYLKSRVQFIIVNYKESFVNKYAKIISHLSSFKVMNPAVDGRVHCFPGAITGLKFHDHLTVDPKEIPGRYSMPDFRQFLRETYSLKVENVSGIEKPVLMLISRTSTRKFLNEREMVSMMKGIGFDVIVAKKPEKMSNLNKFSKLVNKCSVLVGTHGAGLTNQLFLPNGAVTIQIEPLGLEWPSAFYFGNPAPAMGVHYMRYMIKPEESSLLEQYGPNHPVIVDPASIFAQGFQFSRTTYVDQQNMKLDVSRLRKTLIEALRLIGHPPPSDNY